MEKPTKVESLLLYGALAQMVFDMDPYTLKIEQHVIPPSGRIKVIKRIDINSDEFDPTATLPYELDEVYFKRYATKSFDEIWMAYSDKFNTLYIGVP